MMQGNPGWEALLFQLEKAAIKEQKEAILFQLHKQLNTGFIRDPAFLDRLAALYRECTDLKVSTSLKRLQNRFRCRQVVGDDLLKMPTAPTDTPEIRQLWADAHALKAAYESGTKDGASFAERYSLGEMIGEGGMSQVFRATRRADGQDVAIKYLKREHFDNPVVLKRFRQECTLSKTFNHPHIVQVFEADAADEGGYIVMEYLKSGSVSGYLGTPVITPAIAVGVIRQSAEALSYIHSLGVVHRDLKLSNLLIADQEPSDDASGYPGMDVKLADFGLSKDLVGDGLTRDGVMIGTWFYASPEQIQSPRSVDERADVYSLGVCFYRMLTGDGYPVGDYPPASERWPGLPREIDGFIKRCTAENRDDRYPSMAILLGDLAAIAEKMRAATDP